MTTDAGQALGDLRKDAVLTGQAPLCSQAALFDIDAKGQWHYQGSPLPEKFARLFCSILHRIGEEYFLLTAMEKVRVTVADVPLLIVDYRVCDAGFELSSSIGSHHHLDSFQAFTQDDRGPVFTLARGVQARFNRACFYRFAQEYLLEDDETSAG
jgi:uncharacterized protein